MNVLLIGGNGFIGSHLIDCLLKEGHSIRVFDIAHEVFRKPVATVDYRIATLDDIAALYEAMLDMDMVIHLASTSVPSTSGIDLTVDINKNLITSINILNLVVRQRIQKFVYFSSGGAIYGNAEQSLRKENQVLDPISSYGILKLTIEQYIKLFHIQEGIDYLIVRPSNPFGPRQGHFGAHGVISTFLRKTLLGEPITIFGDGKSKKDYIFIDTFIALFSHLIKKNASGIFNIGSGTGTSLNDIVSVINKVTSKEPVVNYSKMRKYDVKSFVLDITKLKSFLDTETIENKLYEGVTQTWEWMQQNGQAKTN